MNWREFLKPTPQKMLLTVFMLISVNVLFWYTWGTESYCGVAEEGFSLECVPPPSYILRITLVSATPFYLIACLVVFIQRRMREKDKVKNE